MLLESTRINGKSQPPTCHIPINDVSPIVAQQTAKRFDEFVPEYVDATPQKPRRPRAKIAPALLQLQVMEQPMRSPERSAAAAASGSSPATQRMPSRPRSTRKNPSEQDVAATALENGTLDRAPFTVRGGLDQALLKELYGYLCAMRGGDQYPGWNENIRLGGVISEKIGGHLGMSKEAREYAWRALGSMRGLPPAASMQERSARKRTRRQRTVSVGSSGDDGEDEDYHPPGACARYSRCTRASTKPPPKKTKSSEPQKKPPQPPRKKPPQTQESVIGHRSRGPKGSRPRLLALPTTLDEGVEERAVEADDECPDAQTVRAPVNAAQPLNFAPPPKRVPRLKVPTEFQPTREGVYVLTEAVEFPKAYDSPEADLRPNIDFGVRRLASKEMRSYQPPVVHIGAVPDPDEERVAQALECLRGVPVSRRQAKGGTYKDRNAPSLSDELKAALANRQIPNEFVATQEVRANKVCVLRDPVTHAPVLGDDGRLKRESIPFSIVTQRWQWSTYEPTTPITCLGDPKRTLQLSQWVKDEMECNPDSLFNKIRLPDGGRPLPKKGWKRAQRDACQAAEVKAATAAFDCMLTQNMKARLVTNTNVKLRCKREAAKKVRPLELVLLRL